MRCEDVQNLIAVAGDGLLDDGESETLDRHLSVCPLCRQERDDIRNLTRDLRMLRRPAISARTVALARKTIAEQVSAASRSFWLAEDQRPWTTWLMPSSVGTLASVLFGFLFLWTLFLIPAPKSSTWPLVSERQDAYRQNLSESLRSYAHTRKDISNESPSVNPEGALVALTNSLVQGNMKDGEVVVVADVFGNGLAKID